MRKQTHLEHGDENLGNERLLDLQFVSLELLGRRHRMSLGDEHSLQQHDSIKSLRALDGRLHQTCEGLNRLLRKVITVYVLCSSHLHSDELHEFRKSVLEDELNQVFDVLGFLQRFHVGFFQKGQDISDLRCLLEFGFRFLELHFLFLL